MNLKIFLKKGLFSPKASLILNTCLAKEQEQSGSKIPYLKTKSLAKPVGDIK